MYSFPWRRFALFCALAIITGSAQSPRPADAISGPPGPILARWRYYNLSDRCMWVTTYWSYTSEAHWRMVSGSQWVKPHSSSNEFREQFNQVTLGPQLKWRAEVRPTATCSGSGGQNVWDQRTLRRNTPVFESTNSQYYRVELLGSNGNYKFYTHGPS